MQRKEKKSEDMIILGSVQLIYEYKEMLLN